VQRVLVVDGDEAFRDALAYLLRKEGFEVLAVGTGREGMAACEQGGVDLVLLERVLPDMRGTEVCGALRCAWPAVGIIVIGARGGEIDTVVALEAGADDYVTKPFSPRELVARMWAVIRRRRDWAMPVAVRAADPGTLAAGPVRMDIERHVVAVAGHRLTVPLREFDLLALLLRNAGRVVTRVQLIDRLWGADHAGATRSLDVHVKRLRDRIEPDPAKPRHLLTVRGLGYKFEP
jgi:two-component system response regulator RegX3